MGKSFVIDEPRAGKRADVVATEALPGLSRAYVHTLIEGGHITLNGQNFKPGHKLRLGDKMVIDFDEAELEQIPEIDLPVIYEDDDVLVIDKPVGIISHARGRFWNEPSVASFVRQRTGQEGERAGIVHRLDRATSGVMICAKNFKALSYLQKQFSARKVGKAYLAIVHGHLNEAEAVIDMPIGRNPNKPQTFRAGANGKPAQTHYKVLKSFSGYDKLLLTPTTGRTHQLRVHLNHLKHPIVGDTLYGKEPAERLLLHAYKLELTLPDGKREVFTAKEPNAFMEFESNNA